MKREHDEVKPVNKEMLSTLVNLPVPTKAILKDRMISSGSFNRWLDTVVSKIASK